MKALDWFLDPAKRKALYGVLAAFGSVLVALGVANDSLVTGIVGTVVAVLNAAALVLASWKARRWDMTALYGAAAAIVVALRFTNLFDAVMEQHVQDVLAQAFALLGLLPAFARTTSATPTGEPQAEYLARHATVPLELIPPEE